MDTKKLNMIGLLAVGDALMHALYAWGKDSLADGKLDEMEATALASPIESALNGAMALSAGKRLRVTIMIDEGEGAQNG